jgi:hypothetical protein
MNIFDPQVSGSLSVSGSSEISGDLRVLGTLFATISGTAENAVSTSHAAAYTLTSSFHQFTSSYTTGAFTGSFGGNGAGLYNIPASGVTGLNLNKIVSGSVSASISPNQGLTVNTNITVSGSILPNDTLSFDLGSDSKRWRDIYLAGNTINLGGTKITKDENGNVQLKDSSNNLKNIIASEFQIGEGANAIIIKRDGAGYFRLAGDTQPYIAAQLSGSFTGSGAGLYDIPASGVTGLNLTRIADGSATASISQADGLRINTNTELTGSLKISNINLGSDKVILVNVTDSGGKFFIDGVRSPILSLIKGFTYKFLFPNIGAHPFRFSTTNDGTHNGGTVYTTGVTTGSTPDYIQIEVTDSTPSTLYYFCALHHMMGNGIGVYSDLLNVEADRQVVYVDPSRIATTGSNSFIGTETISGSLSVTGSVNITGSISLNGQAIGTGKLDEIVFNSYTSSNDTTNSLQNGRLDLLETATSSLNTYTSSTDSKLNAIELTTGSLNSYTSSTNTRLGIIETSTGSLNTFTSSTNIRLGIIETSTGSLNSFTSSASSKLLSIETSTASLNSFTSSTNSSLNAIHISTGSLNSYTSSNISNINSIHTATSSLNSFSSSILSAVEVTGSNLTVKGNLLVKGTTTQIDSTTLNIGDNIISLNGAATNNAGLVVQDASGASIISGSLLWDTSTDFWKAGKLGSEERIVLVNEYNTLSTSIDSRASSLQTATSSLNSYTSSNTTNINAIHTATSSLNTFTSSANGRLNSLETTTGSLNIYTSSTNTRLGVIESTTSSLNTFTSSTNVRLNSLETASGSIRNDFNTFTSSNNSIESTQNSRLNNLETASGSIITDFNSYTSSNNTTNTTQNSRLTAIETTTGSLNTYTSSTNTRLGVIESTTGSLNSYTSSTNTRLNNIETSTGSLNTFSSSTNNRLSSLESASSSIRTDFNSFTSSNNSVESTQNSRLSALETSTSSLNSYTSSNTTNITAIHTATSSLNSYTSSTNTRLGVIESTTSSLNTYTSSTNTRLGIIETSTGSLNSYTTSNNSNINAIHTSTSSLNSFTSSINTTIKNRLNAENVISGSVQVTLSSTTGYSTFSSSLATTDLGQNNRLDSIEGKTGSYATTGSNTYQGSQTITGSLYISQDLIVGGSSSINFISQSTLNIGTNLITVNAQNPGTRFGGLAVIDSGSSPTVSGSMLFDSINDQWVFVHQAIVGSPLTSSVLLMGPQSYDSLGSELYPTVNRIIKSVNAEHLGDSNITDTGTKVSINSNTEVTGTLKVTENISSPNITAIETSTGSLNTFTSSILAAVELTGSNLTVKGNLLVKGTTTNVNTTTLDVDNNLINLNGTGATFAGLRVKDTTAPNQISGSLLWDATNDYWIAGQLGSEQRLVRETEFNNVVNRVGSLETSTASLNTYTSSTNTRLGVIESTTSSLNSYTSSTNNRLSSIETSTGSLNTFTSSAAGRLSSLETASGSIRTDFNSYTSSNNTTNNTQNSRLTAIESTTSSLNSYTSSNNTNITAIHTATSSLNSYTSSSNSRLSSIETATSSLNSYTSSNNTTISGQNSRLTAIETTTGSLNSYTSSNTTNINAIHTATSSLNSYTSSNNTNISAIHTATSSLNSYTSSNTTNINAIHTATASLNSFTSSAGGRLNSIEGVTGSIASLNTYTGSNNTVIGTLQVATSSLNSYTASNNTNINAIHTATSSLNTFTNSFNSAFSLSGADVTIKGNFTVSGTTTTVNSTTVAIGDNIIQLNGSGATNAGIVVRDATSPTTTSGSLLWDTTNDKWIAGPLGAEDDVVLRTATQTLTNKTINASQLVDASVTNAKLANSSFNIGTTSISLGRSSASQTLTGVSIDGNSATVTNGVYTTGDQTIGGAKTFSSNITNSATADWYMYGFGTRGASSGQYGMGLASDIANRTLSFHVPNHTAYSSSGAVPKFGWYSNGAVELMSLQSATGNLVVTGTIAASNLSGTNTGDQTTISGNAGSATILQTARNIGGVSFNGSANIDLPGVNTTGNQNTTGNANTSTTLQTARTIGGVSFNGSANIDLPGVNTTGNQNTSGTASNITAFTINQNVGSGNTPTFAGLTVGAGLATGRSSWGAPTNANIILTSSASDSTGNCGIEFRSGNNFPSDGASIYFENNASGGASERAKLTIRVENDAEDFMELRAGNITLNSNTISAGGQNPSIIFQNSGTTISSISSTGVYNGSISGNAATVTNGVYTNGSYSDPSWITLLAGSKINGAVASATNATAAANISLTSLGNGSVNVNNGSSAVYRNENGSGAALSYSPVFHAGAGDTMWQIQGTYGTSGNGTFYFRQGYSGSWGNWLTMLSSANYNSYSPTLTGGNASGTWGISITGNAATATSADQIDGVGFRNTGSNDGVNAQSLDSNGMTYVTNVDGSSTNLTGNATDGALYSQIYSSSWQHQIYGDYRTGIMYARGKNNGTWQSWKRVALSNSTTFSNVSSVSFTHNLGTANLTAQVFDSSNNMFFPSEINITSTTVTVTFAANRTGRLVVTG